MKAIVGIVIAGVFVNAVRTAEPKGVNIALETILRFDKKDQTPGLTVIDKVQDALEKFKDTLIFRRNNPPPSTFTDLRRSNSRDITFADFILQAAKILTEYDDNDLEDVFAVIYDESRKYINRESEVQDLFGSRDLRRHLSEQLDGFEDVPAKQLRRHLYKAISAIEKNEENGDKNDLLDIGKFLYLGVGDKFKAALKNLERLQKTKDIHVEVVLRDTLRSLVFDHFSNLNHKIKRELIEMAKDYWRVYSRKDGENAVIKPIGVTRLSYKKRNKQDYKYKARPDIRQMAQPRTVHQNTGHENKRYTNKFRTKYQEFTQLNNINTRLPNAFEMKRIPQRDEFSKKSLENTENDKLYLKDRNYKSEKIEAASATSHEKSNILAEEDEKLNGDKSAQSDFMVVMGGMRSIGIRGQREETTKQPKNIENEIITVEERVREQQHRTAPFISVERFTTENTVASDEDNDITASIKNTGISGEGLTIESFEKELPVANKVMRKNNAQDTLGLEDPTTDVKEIIQNIEKQIKDVKEQVSYVRNLSSCTDKPSKPRFKTVNETTTLSKLLSKAKGKYHYPDSDAIDRDNENFFTQDVLENVVTETTASLAFRANEVDTTAAVIIKNINITKTIEKTTDKIIATTVLKLNESKVKMSLESTITTKDENDINKTKDKLINNKTNDVINNITDKLNANDARKFIAKVDDKMNEIDHKNTSLLNYVLMPQSTLNFNFSTNIPSDELNVDHITYQDIENINMY